MGSQFPNQGLNQHPVHLEGKVLTMGPPGKSPDLLNLENFLKSDFHFNIDLNLFSSFKYVLICNWKIFIEQVFGFFFFLNVGSCRYVIGGPPDFYFLSKGKRNLGVIWETLVWLFLEFLWWRGLFRTGCPLLGESVCLMCVMCVYVGRWYLWGYV